MPRLALLLGLALPLLAGCETETGVPAAATVTPEAVERYRTEVVVPLQEIDGAIAALEARAAEADSAGAVAYGHALETLRRERRQVQTDLDALPGMTTDAVAGAIAALDARIAALRQHVANAPVALAQTPEQLRQAAQARFQALDEAVAEDPALQQAQGELVQRRQQIEGELARLGAPEVAFTEVRDTVYHLFAELFERVEALRGGAAPNAAPADTAAT